MQEASTPNTYGRGDVSGTNITDVLQASLRPSRYRLLPDDAHPNRKLVTPRLSRYRPPCARTGP